MRRWLRRAIRRRISSTISVPSGASEHRTSWRAPAGVRARRPSGASPGAAAGGAHAVRPRSRSRRRSKPGSALKRLTGAEADRVVGVVEQLRQRTAPSNRSPPPAAPAAIGRPQPQSPAARRRLRAPSAPSPTTCSWSAVNVAGGWPYQRRERVGGPPQRLVHVAQVARVGPARVQRLGNRGAPDGVAADRLQEAVGGVRHVAVVAGAARTSPRRDWCAASRWPRSTDGTACTRRSLPIRAQLIDRPLRPRPRIVWLLVQRVARRTRQGARGVGRLDEARATR